MKWWAGCVCVIAVSSNTLSGEARTSTVMLRMKIATILRFDSTSGFVSSSLYKPASAVSVSQNFIGTPLLFSMTPFNFSKSLSTEIRTSASKLTAVAI